MKVIIITNSKIRFEGVDYEGYNFSLNIYKELMKSIKQLIETSVNNPTDLNTKIALRLKKGEKLEICSCFEPAKLTLRDIHNSFVNFQYSKYLEVTEPSHYYNDKIYVLVDGYKFKPNIESWYNESKLLNETNLKIVVNDYLNELNQELDKFECMISYSMYNVPDYYEDGKLTYKQMAINGKIMKVTRQCLAYIKKNHFTKDEIKNIIYNDINNVIIESSETDIF